MLHGADEMQGSALVSQVDHDQALQFLMPDRESLLPEPREALVQWFEGEWQALTQDLPAGSSAWWFKESKGVLGFRQGIVIVRNCRILRSNTMIEDN